MPLGRRCAGGAVERNYVVHSGLTSQVCRPSYVQPRRTGPRRSPNSDHVDATNRVKSGRRGGWMNNGMSIACVSRHF